METSINVQSMHKRNKQVSLSKKGIGPRLGLSREKLKDVQVFTPRWAADDMLDMINESFQSTDFCFFEPTCGRGDIVIPILDRLSKYHGSDYAIENVFGIDIDPVMIEQCKGRVHLWCINNGVKVQNWKNIDLNFRVQDFFDCFNKE